MGQQWRTDLEAWVTGWDAVDGDGPGGPVSAWNGAAPDAAHGAVVCEPAQEEAVQRALTAAGRRVTATEALLTGDVRELDRDLDFPGDAGLFDAPMGEHLRFEVDEWGRPVAHSTLSVEGDVAFMGPLVAEPSPDRDPVEVLDPLVSAMANEAFLADAERLYTVVGQEEAAARASQGWQRAASVLRFS